MEAEAVITVAINNKDSNESSREIIGVPVEKNEGWANQSQYTGKRRELRWRNFSMNIGGLERRLRGNTENTEGFANTERFAGTEYPEGFATPRTRRVGG